MPENQKQSINEYVNVKLITEFERISNGINRRCGINIVFQLLGIGLLFLAFHGICFFIARSQGTGDYNMFEDDSVLLPPLIILILFLNFVAAQKFKDFFIDVFGIAKMEEDVFKNDFYDLIKKTYSGWSLGLYGLFWGLFTASISLVFGFPYHSFWLCLSFFTMLFFAGFASGLSFGGIFSIIWVIGKLSDNKKFKLDYYNYDNCAGTSSIGEVLLYTALYIILGAVAISYCIFVTKWTNIYPPHMIDSFADIRKSPVEFAWLLWMTLPVLISIITFFSPFYKTRRMLTSYRDNQLKDLRSQSKEVYLQILHSQSGPNQIPYDELSSLKNRYDLLRDNDAVLSKLNTVPYDLSSLTIYGGAITFLFTIIKFYFSKG